MIHILSGIFLKDEMDEGQRRTALGMLCGSLGIFLNGLLFAGKLAAGLISGSVSIMADAFNNLSDAGSSTVTLIGFRLASQKPDAHHPYGHGRIEYLSGLVISAIILAMGLELMLQSVKKIIHPEVTEFSPLILVILAASIGVKCYMAFYNFSVGKQIDSVSVSAAARDSLSDCIATGVVLVTAVIAHFTGLSLDGWAGVLVSLFILYAGLSSCRESVDPLLGIPPEPEYIQQICDTVVDFDENIVGVHDLMVHDYGPGRKIISLHAEVPSDGNILELHDIIDNLEKKLSADLGCVATIHMDPVNIRDPRVQALKDRVAELLPRIYPGITIHDFRTVFGESHTNLIFDMAVPFECGLTDAEVRERASELIRSDIGSEYYAVIDIDRGTL